MNMPIPSGVGLINYFEEAIKNNMPPVIGIDAKYFQLVYPTTEAVHKHADELNYNLRDHDGLLREILVIPAGGGDLRDKLRNARRDGVGIIVVYSSFDLSKDSIDDMETLNSIGLVSEY